MSRKGGFTLIELIIAVALMVLLVAVALPRYTSFSQRQDFGVIGQKLTACIQKAQQDAIAPTPELSQSSKPLRFTVAQVSSTGVCHREYLTNGPTNGDMVVGPAQTDPYLISSTDPESFGSIGWDDQHPGGIIATGLTSIAPVCTTIRIYFGVLEKGVPVAFGCDGSISTEKSIAPEAGYTSGISLSITLYDLSNKAEADQAGLSNTSGTLTMERLGIPIQFQLN